MAGESYNLTGAATLVGYATYHIVFTIRDRDSLEQVRVGLDSVRGWLQERMFAPRG